MNFVKPKVFDITKRRPAVLLVGNGLNRCMGDDTTWDNAILKLAKDDAILDKIKRLDYSIRATVTADEDDSKRWQRYVKLFDNDFKYFDNPLLKNLLRVPFDAVLTTNYTYELENALDENYPRSDKKEGWACTTAANFGTGKQPDSVRLLNTFNRLKNEDGNDVDIWHIHGEVRDPASMILTHEEYGRLVTELVREEQNENNEGEILFDSWQDYFVYGDLYILGQGVNFAEFDLWWMLSRRRREKTGMGRTFYYAPQQASKKYTDVEEALDQIGLKIENCGITLPEFGSIPQDEMNQIFRNFYDTAANRIKNKIEHPLPLDTELLIEYRNKAFRNPTKTNRLRLLYQLAKTKIWVATHYDKEGNLLLGSELGDEEEPHIYSTNDNFSWLDAPEECIEMTGLDALELAQKSPYVNAFILDPEAGSDEYSGGGRIYLPMAQAEYVFKGVEWLRSYVEAADEKDLARRKNNVNKASEATHYIKSFISNCTFDDSLEEVWSDIDGQGYFNYEMMLHDEEVQWTSPKNSEPGDIVFFMHTQSSKSKITKLKSELKSRKDSISEDRYLQTERELNRALANYEKYGRKIFAIGQVVEETEIIADDDPFYEDPSLYHFNSRHFSCITNIFELRHPVSMDEFNDFIAISKFGSITPVHGEKFNQLRNLICEKNKDMEMPMYFLKSTAADVDLADLRNGKWMQIENTERKKFNTKNAYQSYYTDFLLQTVGDTKKIFTNRRYSRLDADDAFIDNVISVGNCYLPVRIFPSILDEDQAAGALEKYCSATKITIAKDKIAEPPQIYTGKVLGIDLNHVFIYDADTKQVHIVQVLDDLKSDDDITALKQKLTTELAAKTVINNETDKKHVEANRQVSDYIDSASENIDESQEDPIVITIINSDPVLPVTDNSTESGKAIYQGTLYIPADYPDTPIGWAEYCQPSNKGEIMSRAVLIVDGEKVIERNLLMEKLRSSFGVRNSEKVMEATEKALKSAKIKTTKVKGVQYCWAEYIDPKTYTGFCFHEEIKRKDNELPLPEVRNAIVRTLMDSPTPLDEDELLVQTARVFGYQRLGPNLRNRLSEGIAYAISDKMIRLNKQKKYELREG